MTTIIIRIVSTGWQATFRHFDDIPNNVALPLPFAAAASAATVRADLRQRFPFATIITKASSRDRAWL